MKTVLIAGENGKTENYEKALRSLGILPVCSLKAPYVYRYDGLLLPGGGDIDPRLFGQLSMGTREFDLELDRVQLAILNGFVQERKPVLGICKGMQLINIYFGGDLFQDLETAEGHEYIGRDQVHDTQTVKGSWLEKLYGERFRVNSAHHQGVDSPGRRISYVQTAPDGVIEGLKHDFLPVFGVQWHPERLLDKRPDGAVDGRAVLRYFAEQLSGI